MQNTENRRHPTSHIEEKINVELSCVYIPAMAGSAQGTEEIFNLKI